MAVRKNRHDPFRSSIIGEPLCRSRRPTKTAYQQFRGIGSPTFSLAFTHRRSDGRQGRRDEHRDVGAQAQSGTTASLRRWRYDAAASTQRQRDVGTGRRSVYVASPLQRRGAATARCRLSGVAASTLHRQQREATPNAQERRSTRNAPYRDTRGLHLIEALRGSRANQAKICPSAFENADRVHAPRDGTTRARPRIPSTRADREPASR